MRGDVSANSMGVNSGFSEAELRKQGLVTVGILLLTGLVMVGGAMWCSADGARERMELGMGSSYAASPQRGAATKGFGDSEGKIQTSAGE
jgi:hypothetical protein